MHLRFIEMVVGLLNLRQAGSRHLRHLLKMQSTHHTLGDCKVPEAVGHKMGLSSGIDLRDRHDVLEVLVERGTRVACASIHAEDDPSLVS